MKPILSTGESMTPDERFHALMQGTSLDRPPVDLFLSDIKAKLLGKSLTEYRHFEEYLVQGEILAFNLFAMDFVGVGPNLYPVAEAMGSLLYDLSDAPLTVRRYALHTVEDIDSLPPLQITDSLKTYLYATKRLRHLFDRICPVVISLPGPMTLAALLLRTDKLLFAIQKKPETIKHLMRYVVNGLKIIIKEFAAIDVHFSISDPVASENIINSDIYKNYVFTPTEELCRFISDRSSYAPSYHICGDTKNLWPVIRQLPISIFSIGNSTSLSDACRFFSQSKIIAGNVDAVGVLLQGDQTTVTQAVHTALDSGMLCRKGFILAPGCDIPITTPFENIRHFIAAARSF